MELVLGLIGIGLALLLVHVCEKNARNFASEDDPGYLLHDFNRMLDSHEIFDPAQREELWTRYLSRRR